jgi:serine/threonine protein kinase
VTRGATCPWLLLTLLLTASAFLSAPQVRNEKARRFLANMRKKPGVNWDTYFPRADKGALALLKRLLAFDPCDRPTAEEALADPYFAGGQGDRALAE